MNWAGLIKGLAGPYPSLNKKKKKIKAMFVFCFLKTVIVFEFSVFFLSFF